MFRFNLYGFDAVPKMSLYGFWFCEVITKNEGKRRSLFGAYYGGSVWHISILWFNLPNYYS